MADSPGGGGRKFAAGNKLSRSGTTARCPHCESPGIVRTSTEMTILCRDVYFICSNVECGHSWKAQLSFVHTIGRPANPRPDLHLPVSPEPARRHHKQGADPPAAEQDAA